MGNAVFSTVLNQKDTLAANLNLSASSLGFLLSVFAQEALKGPFTNGRRRLSGINPDGVPFQWSVSISKLTANLRFLTEVGCLQHSNNVRVKKTWKALRRESSVDHHTLSMIEGAVEILLPPKKLLVNSLMGLWIGVSVKPHGESDKKIYINQSDDQLATRYKKLSNFLEFCGRQEAAIALREVSRVVGTSAIPTISSFDISSNGLGRIKLYLRLQADADRIVRTIFDILQNRQGLEDFNLVTGHFLDKKPLPANACIVSIEFWPDANIYYKVDLSTRLVTPSDERVNRSIERLLMGLRLPLEPYCIVRDCVSPRLSEKLVESILYVGLAHRPDGHQVDVYFHPYPKWFKERSENNLGLGSESS